MTNKEAPNVGSVPVQGESGSGWVRRTGLVLGPALYGCVLVLGQGTQHVEALAVGAVALWMACWWMTEAIPLPATALLPIVLFPASGVVPAREVTLSYGHPVIFLFLGGFLLSAAFKKSGLARRVALRAVGLFGLDPRRVVLGVMAATALLSMWISNTACVVMMVPIALGVAIQVQGRDRAAGSNFGKALMLGVAYSASIGGLGTIVGSPPNAIFVGYLETSMDRTVTFLDWMLYGIPLVAAGVPLAWFYLTRIACPLGREPRSESGSRHLLRQLASLGVVTTAEKRVLLISGSVACLWVLRGLWPHGFVRIGLEDVNDTMIAILGALLLFALSARKPKLLEWSDAREIPWGVLILFGGGLALANGIRESGLGAWMADQLSILEGFPHAVLVLAATLVVIFLTELTSNTATATIFIPIMAALAAATGEEPYPLMLAATTAASCAFMLPVATPPNAIVFGSGYLRIGEMIRAGLALNLVFAILLFAAANWWLPLIWG